METPAFEESDPAGGCACPGCVLGRRVPPCSAAPAGTGRSTARSALVLAVAAGIALGAGHCGPAVAVHAPAEPGVPAGDGPGTPQGQKEPLHGPAGRPASVGTPAPVVDPPATTRTDIINRAQTWVTEQVPYSMTAYRPDGYRQDCSGYVSMAWNLGLNEWTGSLAAYGDPISRDELQPGDILLFHNPEDPQNGSHVVIFGGWTDYTHTHYIAYEQTRPHTRKQSTPYAYWSNSERYVPYRYKGLVPGGAGAGTVPAGAGGAPEPEGAGTAHFPGVPAFGNGAHDGHVTGPGRMLVRRGGTRSHTTGPGPRGAGRPEPYPGRGMFRPGAVNHHVDRLGRRLVEKGFGRYYATGPGRRWSEADRRNVAAFQRAQGWRGAAADGYPGPETWRRLFS
ncbi:MULTISPECIES: peptidoglycan-binding protein [Streptomyces]|nr:peptidoglycan-binding protein [Streptomyces ruber]